MGVFSQQVGYYLSHPDAIIYTVATALLYPVLFLELAALVFTVFELGRFTFEMIARGRRRSLKRIEHIATRAREDLAAGRNIEALERLKEIGRTWAAKHFIRELGDDGDLETTRLLKLLTDLELAATRRLERTRMMIRFGPILGLMGTLIPISPALVALAKGDIETLATNLVVAFSTTVVGLLIGGLAVMMSMVRDRLYTQDVSDIEYALELMEV